ncbi:MAG: hypothetical protein ACLRZH_01350 [Ruthenibacterium lactatiformans]
MRKITDEREALGREIARLTEQKEQKDASTSRRWQSSGKNTS